MSKLNFCKSEPANGLKLGTPVPEFITNIPVTDDQTKSTMSREKLQGVDLSLYKVKVFNSNGTLVGTVKVFDYSRRMAYITANKHLPAHLNWDADWIRFAEDGEVAGVKLEKNDRKRKQTPVYKAKPEGKPVYINNSKQRK